MNIDQLRFFSRQKAVLDEMASLETNIIASQMVPLD